MSIEIKQKLNVDEALAEDKAFNEGVTEYSKVSQQAQTVSEEIASVLVESIVKSVDNKDPQPFTLSTAILAAAKSMTNLTSYCYDDHELFMQDIKRARELVVSRIIPALLDPRPCGLCVNCKNGHPEECINPVMDKENVQTKFLPMIATFIIEHDLWSKITYMYTAGKVNTDPVQDDASVDKPVDNVDKANIEVEEK